MTDTLLYAILDNPISEEIWGYSVSDAGTCRLSNDGTKSLIKIHLVDSFKALFRDIELYSHTEILEILRTSPDFVE